MGVNPGLAHPFFAVSTDIFKKKIAESDGTYAFAMRVFHSLPHGAFTLIAAARVGNLNRPKRQPRSLSLRGPVLCGPRAWRPTRTPG
jgi:hypothetical protein